MERTDEASRVLALLEHARRRAAGAMPGSPDWEAAMAAVEELEGQLDALEDPDPTPSIPSPGSSIVTFGPRSLGDGQVVQGSFAGQPASVGPLEQAVVQLADRVSGRREFGRELERLALAHGFVLEANPKAWGTFVFYAWDRASAATTGD